MEVVLLERVKNLGLMGDVVKVKDGFARNFLLPQEKALRATPANLALFESERADLEARNIEDIKEAEAIKLKIDGHRAIILRQASEMDQLYGSVTNRDVAEILTADGFIVDRRQVRIDEPIKNLGLHELQIDLHPEVTATISINVARSEEEALQREASASEDSDETVTESFFENDELAHQADAELADEEESEETSVEHVVQDSAEDSAEDASDSEAEKSAREESA